MRKPQRFRIQYLNEQIYVFDGPLYMYALVFIMILLMLSATASRSCHIKFISRSILMRRPVGQSNFLHKFSVGLFWMNFDDHQADYIFTLHATNAVIICHNDCKAKKKKGQHAKNSARKLQSFITLNLKKCYSLCFCFDWFEGIVIPRVRSFQRLIKHRLVHSI